MKNSVFGWAGLLACMVAAPLAQAQDDWVVGQSAPLTGSNAAFGKDIRDGALAYFKSVNARGGVGGKNIELVTLDDANDRKTAGANTQKLLTSNNAAVLFGYASATLSLDAMPQADKAGVLFFAPFSGANPVRAAPPVRPRRPARCPRPGQGASARRRSSRGGRHGRRCRGRRSRCRAAGPSRQRRGRGSRQSRARHAGRRSPWRTPWRAAESTTVGPASRPALPRPAVPPAASPVWRHPASFPLPAILRGGAYGYTERVNPPSMRMFWPVMYDERADARKAISSATSSARP